MKIFLLAAGATFIGLSGLFHAYIFYLESLIWTKPRTWRTFGVPSQEAAEIIRPMAFNQGFYNLFLALEIVAGLIALGINSTVGFTLLIAAALSISGAGIVLFYSVKTSRRAAIIQATPPLLGLVLIFAGYMR